MTELRASLSRCAAWRAIRDDKGRIVVAICHNSDIGDAWEWTDSPTAASTPNALIELQRTPYNDARMAEALSFVQEAINAVTQTHHLVKRLPAAVKHIEQPPKAGGAA
jgi:hypothetical protein